MKEIFIIFFLSSCSGLIFSQQYDAKTDTLFDFVWKNNTATKKVKEKWEERWLDLPKMLATKEFYDKKNQKIKREVIQRIFDGKYIYCGTEKVYSEDGHLLRVFDYTKGTQVFGDPLPFIDVLKKKKLIADSILNMHFTEVFINKYIRLDPQNTYSYYYPETKTGKLRFAEGKNWFEELHQKPEEYLFGYGFIFNDTIFFDRKILIELDSNGNILDYTCCLPKKQMDFFKVDYIESLNIAHKLDFEPITSTKRKQYSRVDIEFQDGDFYWVFPKVKKEWKNGISGKYLLINCRNGNKKFKKFKDYFRH